MTNTLLVALGKYFVKLTVTRFQGIQIFLLPLPLIGVGLLRVAHDQFGKCSLVLACETRQAAYCL